MGINDVCFICNRLTLDNDLCDDCRHEVDRNNETVYLLTLLVECIKYPLPVYLRERIEAVLNSNRRAREARYRGVQTRVRIARKGK